GGRADHGEVLDGSNNQDERHPMEAAILRFSPDGTDVSVYARGFRNPYDIAWDASGNLWAGDNGRDGNIAANDIAPDELHLVQPGGEHGYPYYDCPACFGVDDGVQLVEPIFAFEPHSVPTGMTVYQHEQFPGYFNNLFVTLWTALPFAERVMRFLPDGSAGTFATGFAAPMDVVVASDGNLFVADFATGLIFRIEYVGQ
ncbi:MAG: PQQ-dependent sugar dehydrogenase, partial [Methylococcales bacterium]|nr:PQQ-dependent sugar dehydrogenase [Methylococcales bacterium]